LAGAPGRATRRLDGDIWRPFARRGGLRDSELIASSPSAEALGFDMSALPGLECRGFVVSQ